MSSEENNRAFFTQVFTLIAKILKESGPYMTASYTMIGAVVGLSLLGYYADRWLNTTPWLLILGVILGLVVGFYEIAKVTIGK